MFGICLEHLDERQRRILAGSLARALGRGGIVAVAEASGMSRSTVQAAVRQIDAGLEVTTRVRPPGAGRIRAQDAQPGLAEALDALIQPEARGDPTCPLRWTAKSTRTLARELHSQGFAISHETVARLLHQTGYRLQATQQGGGSGPSDREAQFRHVYDQVARHLNAGEPVISVSTTKHQAHPRDQAVRDQNLSRTGAPVRVDVHDFPDPAPFIPLPHGSDWIPGPDADEGFGAFGADDDTAQLGASAVGRWWDEVGVVAYPGATRILVTGDASGSNGLRSPRWTQGLGILAARARLGVTVANFPLGTTKWNRIEHRLASVVWVNWLGRPLASHEVVICLIANTSTPTGVDVRTRLERSLYRGASG